MTSIVLVVLIMLAVSFYCSIGEAALYAVPPARVEALRAEGSSTGLRLGHLRDRIERPITAILFLNTFANTMGAAIAGALVGAYFVEDAVLPFSVVLTLLVLLFAEIVPKSLGVGYARTLAPWLAWPIQIMVWLFYPLVAFGEFLTRLFSPAAGKDGPNEEEIVALAGLVARGGEILPEEERWVRNVLRLNDITAGDMMTPRPVLETLVGSTLLGDIEPQVPALQYSRLPVITEEGPDHVVGIVLRRQLVNACVGGEKDKKVEDLARPAMFVPAAMRGNDLLTRFIKEKSHMAIVVDEYGGTMGVITLEDVIEEMLGTEIVDEFDPHPDMRAYARARAKVKLNEPDE